MFNLLSVSFYHNGFAFFSIIVSILIAFIFSWFLYNKDIQKKSENYVFFRFTAILRFLSVAIIIFLIFNFSFKVEDKKILKPVIVVGIDNSKSMKLKDNNVKEKIEKNIKDIQNQLKDDYELKIYSFGNTIEDADSINFNENYTDIYSFLKYSYESFEELNLGAIIMATDGIYSKNANPLMIAQNHNIPVYNIAYGDTTVLKDLKIKQVRHNKTVLLNNYFPLECNVIADKLKGKTTTLTIEVNGKIIETKELVIKGDNYIDFQNFSIQAKEKGNLFVKISVNPIEGEISTDNNYYAFNINVIDDKKKVLLLYNSPHPDVSAIKQAVKVSDEFSIDEYSYNNFQQDFSKYNIIILHQLPSNTVNVSMMAKVLNNNIPKLFINGLQTDISQFNKLNTGTTISDFNNSFNEVSPTYNNAFALFTPNEDIQTITTKFPPLIIPYGRYTSSSSSENLFYQKIGQVNTSFPLISFNSNLTSKYAVIFGEGIWRWRVYNYLLKENNDLFDELIVKILKYLSTKEEKSKFQISLNETLSEEDNVIFNAELYNDSYEMINEPDVSLNITDKDNKSYNFVFSKNNKSYLLNAGKFTLGNYTYNASVKLGNAVYQKKGIFSILPINYEALNTIADHQLLNNISLKTNGLMTTNVDNIESIITNIKQKKEITSISFFNNKILSLINFKFIMYIIILLLAIEWGIRKYFGRR